MQVNVVPALKNAGSCGPADGLALTIIQGLNGTGAPPPNAREQHEREQRLEREHRQAAQAAAASPSTADVMRQAERQLDPSSRSWKRGQIRAAAREQQLKQGRRAFRQALADAKGRGGRTTEAPTSRGEPARESTRPTQNESPTGRATKPTPVADTDLSKPAAGKHGAQPSTTNSAEPAISTGRAAAAGQTLSATAVRQPAPPVVTGNVASDGFAAVKAAASGAVQSVGEVRPPGAAPVATTPVRSTVNTARAVRQPAHSQPAQTADREANIERVLRTIHSRIGRQRSIAIVRLDPPALGSIRLHLDLRADALTLRVDTQTDVAHRLLTEELASLRRGLESAGIHLERVEIRPPSPAPEGAGESPSYAPDQDGADEEAAGERGAERSNQGGPGIDGHNGTEAGAESGLASQAGATTEEPGPAAESLVNVLA